jgi:hypothetical protein
MQIAGPGRSESIIKKGLKSRCHRRRNGVFLIAAGNYAIVPQKQLKSTVFKGRKGAVLDDMQM